MPGALNNPEFAAGLAALLGLSEPDAADLATLVDDWNDGTVTNTAVANRISLYFANDKALKEEWTALLTGSATGGPLGDGYYTVHDYNGVAYSLASYAKLASQMQKGDPARQDFMIPLQGRIGPGERLPPIPIVVGATYDANLSTIVSDGAPALGPWTVKFWKNLPLDHPPHDYPGTSAWATATLAEGAQSGVVTFAGSSTLADGDRLSAFANPTFDPAVFGVTIVLAGA